MFKKISAFLLCLFILFATVACNDSEQPDTPDVPESTEPATEATEATTEATEATTAAETHDWINVATFNIWHCADITDSNTISPQNISDFIYNYDIGICAMQEVGVNWNIAGGINQPEFIAYKLTQKTGQKYYHAFAPALESHHHSGALYGNAIVSKYPIKSYRAVKMTMREGQVEDGYEHRVMLIAELEINGQILTVISTHFDLKQDARLESVKILKEELAKITTPVVFMGDLNDAPNSMTVSKIAGFMKQAGTGKLTNPTYPTSNPTSKLDYIFTTKDIKSKDIRVATDVKCSDHHPVVVTIGWPKQ